MLSGTSASERVVTTTEAVKSQECVNMSTSCTTLSVLSSDEVQNDTYSVLLLMLISYKPVLHNEHVFGTMLLLIANS